MKNIEDFISNQMIRYPNDIEFLSDKKWIEFYISQKENEDFPKYEEFFQNNLKISINKLRLACVLSSRKEIINHDQILKLFIEFTQKEQGNYLAFYNLSIFYLLFVI